jgi:carbon-monoxide dehydrogenase medium subunit
MTIRSFELLEPRSLPEASGLLTEYGDDARVIGGGTTLVILLKQRALHFPYLIDLRLIPGLGEMKREPEGLCVGAMVTHRAIETSPLVREKFPVIAEAFRHIGNVRIRQTASVGGNLAHADYRLDPPPPLLVLNAEVTAYGPEGARKILLKDFFRGMYETALEPAEILVDLRIPYMPANSTAAYLRFSTLAANDWPCLGVAGLMIKENGRCRELRLALGGVAATPLLITGLEFAADHAIDQGLIAEVQDRVDRQIAPTSDFRGSEWYKRRMARLFVGKILEQLNSAAA